MNIKTTEETSLAKELFNQVHEFMDDDSDFGLYKDFIPNKTYALVKLFRFVPKLTEIEKIIEVKDQYGRYKPYRFLIDYRNYPIVKVLNAPAVQPEDGAGIIIKSGDHYTVPVYEVYGESHNPEYLQLYQYSEVKGAKPQVPPGMRETIPNIEKQWAMYRFQIPWIPPEDQSEDVYCIPVNKLITKIGRKT